MPQARGYKTKVTAIEQDTIDQVPGTPDGALLFYRTFGLRGQQDLQQSETIRGERGRSEPDLGNINVNGQMQTEIDNASIGLLLKHLFGAVATSDTSGSAPYTHDFTVSDSFTKFLLLEKDNGGNISGDGRYERYLGCRVGSAQITMPRDGYPTIDWDFIGADHNLNDTALDDTPTDQGFIPFSAFRGALEMDGSEIATITEARATLSNDLDDDQYVVGGDGKRVDIPEGWFLVSGQITARFVDADLMNKAINGTSVALKYILSRGNGDGSSGNEYFELHLPKLRLQRNSPEVSGPRGIMLTMDFQGYEDAGSLASAQLKNTVASY